ncbi:MAG: PmoA family protein [Verrucomicrobiae bacterium]|nr:PmoA family protein [Verrucomicrobiae bacterium]
MSRLKPFLLATSFLIAQSASSDVRVEKTGDTVTITENGKPFTEYHYKDVSRPFLYPVIGPTGQSVTRNYPMREVPGEARDHVHHRSLWFAHGDINGVDFWAETPHKNVTPGKTVHEAILETKSGPVGLLKTRNKLVAPGGEVIGTEIFTIRFHSNKERRYIDFDVEILASNGDLVMGDTKEGCMAIRLATSMRLRTPDKKPGAGHIVTSEGVTDAATWGQRAAWVDYHGPVDGETVGVAIFDHPSNLRHPTWWHVRDYGLFAANPFGKRYFEKLEDPAAGKHTIPSGKTLKQKYRFLFHKGDHLAAKVAAEYTAWTR